MYCVHDILLSEEPMFSEEAKLNMEYTFLPSLSWSSTRTMIEDIPWRLNSVQTHNVTTTKKESYQQKRQLMLEDDSELKNGNLSGANKSSHRLGDNQQANLSHSTLGRL